jgi:hypothetical protein
MQRICIARNGFEVCAFLGLAVQIEPHCKVSNIHARVSALPERDYAHKKKAFGLRLHYPEMDLKIICQPYSDHLKVFLLVSDILCRRSARFPKGIRFQIFSNPKEAFGPSFGFLARATDI